MSTRGNSGKTTRFSNLKNLWNGNKKLLLERTRSIPVFAPRMLKHFTLLVQTTKLLSRGNFLMKLSCPRRKQLLSRLLSINGFFKLFRSPATLRLFLRRGNTLLDGQPIRHYGTRKTFEVEIMRITNAQLIYHPMMRVNKSDNRIIIHW